MSDTKTEKEVKTTAPSICSTTFKLRGETGIHPGRSRVLGEGEEGDPRQATEEGEGGEGAARAGA